MDTSETVHNEAAQDETVHDETAHDETWMTRALVLAEQAGAQGEVPVGAILVREGQVLGEGYNAPISLADPTAHAEVCALRAAASAANNYRLPGATLYVTLEPCVMCVGAMIHARVVRLVFAASEPRAGAVVSQLSLLDQQHFNHRVQWRGGVQAERSATLLKKFFRERRQAGKRLI